MVGNAGVCVCMCVYAYAVVLRGRYAVGGEDADWDEALKRTAKKGKTPTMVSVRGAKSTKRPADDNEGGEGSNKRRRHSEKKKSKKSKKKHA